MTRRQIVTTLIFIAAGSMGAAASQKPVAEEPGAIRGVVTRVGSTEPISGAQVTLQGGATNPQALQSIAEHRRVSGNRREGLSQVRAHLKLFRRSPARPLRVGSL
jgi:hypothetical protein